MIFTTKPQVSDITIITITTERDLFYFRAVLLDQPRIRITNASGGLCAELTREEARAFRDVLNLLFRE